MSQSSLHNRMRAGQAAALARSKAGSEKTSPISALSANETLLVAGSGWDALDVCTGASVYGMRRDTVNTWGSNQDERASKALNAAMADAVKRLETSCAQSQAHGVIGTRILVEIQPRYVAINLIGTAVRDKDAKSSPSRPFTSNLAARDFLLLLKAGWEPLGLASGGRFVRAYRRNPKQTVSQKLQNVELVNPTQALARARAATMAVLEERAVEFGGQGIVGISLSSGRVPFAPHVLSFLAWGTVVVSAADPAYPAPDVVVSLNDIDRSFDPTALVRKTEDGHSKESR